MGTERKLKVAVVGTGEWWGSLAAFKAGEEPPVHARAGRRALVLAWAIIESFETGRRVGTVEC